MLIRCKQRGDQCHRNMRATGDILETSWIKHPLILRGTNIELRPLEFENRDTLFAVAQDPNIWRLTSVDYSVADVF